MQLVVDLYNSIRSESGRDGMRWHGMGLDCMSKVEAMCRVARLILWLIFTEDNALHFGANDRRRRRQKLSLIHI